jgi:hypothetical protein
MKRIKLLVLALACGAALSVSAAGLTLTQPQNSNQNSEACCDMQGCCKDMNHMSCCSKKTRKGKNAHACCKGKDNAASCCCKGGSCPMPNKKAGTSTSN